MGTVSTQADDDHAQQVSMEHPKTLGTHAWVRRRVYNVCARYAYKLRMKYVFSTRKTPPEWHVTAVHQ